MDLGHQEHCLRSLLHLDVPVDSGSDFRDSEVSLYLDRVSIKILTSIQGDIRRNCLPVVLPQTRNPNNFFKGYNVRSSPSLDNNPLWNNLLLNPSCPTSPPTLNDCPPPYCGHPAHVLLQLYCLPRCGPNKSFNPNIRGHPLPTTDPIVAGRGKHALRGYRGLQRWRKAPSHGI